MTYIASVLSSADAAWTGVDLDLTDVEDLDGLTDQLRDDAGVTAICFLEEDDEYVAIVRVDGDGEPRVFVSDRRVLAADGVAGRLLADTVPMEPAAPPEPVDEEAEDAEEEESGRPEVEPAGDEALLADLGVAGSRLLELCAEEGMLPSDVIFALAEELGAADVLEAVRGI